MSEVLLGLNRFRDCESILAYNGTSVLRVRFNPLQVDLTTPEGLPSQIAVRVDQEGVNPKSNVRIVESPKSFAVFWDETALAVATLLTTETAHLKLDLRPLGISIYDDADGLHIGRNVFHGNELNNCAAAISLGD